MKRALAFVGSLAIAGSVFGYTNPFTLDFNATGGEANWTETSAGSLVYAETTPPGGSPFAPQSAPGYNGNGWARLTTPQANGVAVAYYDGTAGGSTADVTAFSIEADVFIVTDATPANRYQVGIVGSWETGDLFSPLELFYCNNLTGQPNGYGIRGSADTVTGGGYGMFSGVTETSNRWVGMKLVINGTTATGYIDRDNDGTYDITSTPVTFDGVAGKPGLFYVINDGANAIADQFAYFDNFTYTPLSAVADWSLY